MPIFNLGDKVVLPRDGSSGTIVKIRDTTILLEVDIDCKLWHDAWARESDPKGGHAPQYWWIDTAQLKLRTPRVAANLNDMDKIILDRYQCG